MIKNRKHLLIVSLLIALAGGLVFFLQTSKEKNHQNKGQETMTTTIYIDPKIDLTSEEELTVLIHFKTKPAREAVELAKMKGVPLTLEQAEQDVKASHSRFQADAKKYLADQQIPYTITHTYTAAFNGVAIRLPASAINALLQSAEIEAIYANKQMKMVPPIKPS